MIRKNMINLPSDFAAKVRTKIKLRISILTDKIS